MLKLKKVGGEKTLQNREVADEAFRDLYVLHTFCRAPNLLKEGAQTEESGRRKNIAKRKGRG